MPIEQLDKLEPSLANQPPTLAQRRLVLATAIALLVAFAATAPYAALALPRNDAFIPFVAATIIVTDFTTSVLLFSQFAVTRSKQILALANGYLFTALMVIPHMLSFPGAFGPTGILGGGLQTTIWLYIFWHQGFAVAVFAYIWLGRRQRATVMAERLWLTICQNVAGVVALAIVLTLVTTAGHDYLPIVFLNQTHFAPLSDYLAMICVTIGLIALGLLWVYRRSVLDFWLMIVMMAWIAEHIFGAVLGSARFELGWYVGRIYSIMTATVVLAALLGEITRLYTRLARSNMLQRRERENRLMSMEAMAASISHEVRQPLTTIAMNGNAALLYLEQSPPNTRLLQKALSSIVEESHRAGEMLESVSFLFKSTNHSAGPVDVNKIALEAIRVLQGELKRNRISTLIDLQPGQLLTMGHSGQLKEVIHNLISNAIDAMDSIEGKQRILSVSTDQYVRNIITVTVEDSGPGFETTGPDNVFDAFVTTKAKGMGLGLALSKIIVDRHGGELTASTGKLGGAKLQFTLPLKRVSTQACESQSTQ